MCGKTQTVLCLRIGKETVLEVDSVMSGMMGKSRKRTAVVLCPPLVASTQNVATVLCARLDWTPPVTSGEQLCVLRLVAST